MTYRRFSSISLSFRPAGLVRAAAVCALLLLGAGAARAQEHGAEEFDPVHHVSDGYYMDFEPLGKFELPRLFVVRRETGLALDAFSSTRAALASGRFRALETHASGAGEEAGLGQTAADPHEVTEADTDEALNPARHAEPMVAGAMHLESEIVPVEGDLLLDLSITRHLVFAVLGALIVLGLFLRMAARYRAGVGRTSAPRGLLQNLLETLVLFVRDDIARPNIGPKYARYMPYLLTVFFFILTCNLIGLVPFGATATSNLMVTAVLAFITFVITQFSGSRDHWRHILWPPGVPFLLKFILIPVEVLGLFTKPFALTIRLFANMTAGHLVILSLIGLIFSFGSIFGPVAGYGISVISVAFSLFIYLLELLVSFIQAYIFTMLSALFIGLAVAEHHHDEAPHEAHAPEGAGLTRQAADLQVEPV